MKIGFLVNNFPSVSETFIMNDAIELEGRGHSVKIISRNAGEKVPHSKLDKTDLVQDATYMDLPHDLHERVLRSYKPFLSLLSNPEDLAESLKFWKYGKECLSLKLLYFASATKDEEFDVMHAHFGPNGNLAATAKEAGIIDCPVITSFYGIDASKTLKNKPGYFDKAFEGSDKVLALTNNMAEDLIEAGCPREKVETIYMGIPVDEFEYKPREKKEDEPFKLLTIARFTEKKGIRYGLEAVAKLEDEYDIQYDIIGDGPLRAEIEKKIEEENLEDTVNLHGYVDYSELEDWMHKSHILLAPSVTAEDGDKEGAPMVIIEAQATGMPVISTYHSGIPEIVEEGESAFLAKERDSGDLAQKLEYIFENIENWQDIARRGREIIDEKHDIGFRTNKLQRLYGDLNHTQK
jgi:colanic acid/amylovoran biosynthesis glycosyltransferase